LLPQQKYSSLIMLDKRQNFPSSPHFLSLIVPKGNN
jgi:hypothetical protein